MQLLPARFRPEQKMVNVFKKLDGDLLITEACPVDCEFCIYSCNTAGTWMPQHTMRRVAEEYTKNDIGIRICGGEPFFNFKKLEECLDIVLEYQKPHEILIITSAVFGASERKTSDAIKILSDRKMDTMVVSCDRFHLKTVPLSSIIRTIDEAKKQGIKIILRITSDQESYSLMDELAEIIVRHNVKFEFHDGFGTYGRAELLDNALNAERIKRTEYMHNKVQEFAAKYNAETNVSSYEEQSPKRSQRKFAGWFFPTTFPNGNVYGHSECGKASLMGNINNESLSLMIERFSKTLPGYILWSEKRDFFDEMRKFLPRDSSDLFDYCRDHPLYEKTPKEAIGREHVVVRVYDDFHEFLIKAKLSARELLITFELREEDLNLVAGNRIRWLLQALRQNGVRFKICRTLPRCLFGADYNKIAETFKIPRNCYECSELFSVKDGQFRSCKPLGKTGPKLGEVENRNQVLEIFNKKRHESEPCETCKSCKYFKRKLCDGICFRLYDSKPIEIGGLQNSDMPLSNEESFNSFNGSLIKGKIISNDKNSNRIFLPVIQ